MNYSLLSERWNKRLRNDLVPHLKKYKVVVLFLKKGDISIGTKPLSKYCMSLILVLSFEMFPKVLNRWAISTLSNLIYREYHQKGESFCFIQTNYILMYCKCSNMFALYSRGWTALCLFKSILNGIIGLK